MSKIGDIIPAQHRVTLQLQDGAHEVDVRGLSLQDIASLMARYPDVIAQFDGKLDAASLFTLGPQVVAAVMAMACGAPNDKAAEAALLALPLGTQVEIADIIVRETMPNGVGPFVQLAKRFGLDLATVRQKAASQSPSPSPSTSSSEADTTSTE